jgi:DNA polymerase-1
LIAADYSQIELRILAHLSGDPVLLRAFRERVDVHTQTACEVFGVSRDQVTAQHRRVAKAVNYGLIYGQSDFGLARALDIPRREAAEYSARYFERFPSIRQYLASVVAQARKDGGTTTLLGRWRPIRDLSSKTQVARRAAERIAQNTPMQGAGADIMKLAMLRSHARLQREQVAATMLLTVHDELVFEADPSIAEQAGKLIAEEMGAVIELAVPLDVDVGIAANWADA